MGIYAKIDESHNWANPLEYTLVFKGTDTLGDWKNNIEQFFQMHLLICGMLLERPIVLLQIILNMK